VKIFRIFRSPRTKKEVSRLSGNTLSLFHDEGDLVLEVGYIPPYEATLARSPATPHLPRVLLRK